MGKIFFGSLPRFHASRHLFLLWLVFFFFCFFIFLFTPLHPLVSAAKTTVVKILPLLQMKCFKFFLFPRRFCFGVFASKNSEWLRYKYKFPNQSSRPHIRCVVNLQGSTENRIVLSQCWHFVSRPLFSLLHTGQQIVSEPLIAVGCKQACWRSLAVYEPHTNKPLINRNRL